MADKEKIEEVLERWRARLTSINGVMGVAIGLAKDKTQKVIKVYLDRKHIGQAAKIPDQIEGFQVEIEARSTFRAL